jgi:hypothetical protein
MDAAMHLSTVRQKREEARAACLPTLVDDEAFAAASAGWARAFPQRLKLVLHAGTPKTGTTALQQTLFRERDTLAEQGIWYPPEDVDPVKKKHQYLVDILRAADGRELARRVEQIVRSAPSHTRTVVLSTEGLFNHWWDYPPPSKAMLRQLTSTFAVEIWTCFREPLDFAVSQHAQLLRNPKLHSPAYGLDAGLDEMLEIDWFVKRLDYLGFVSEAEELIGVGNVRVFRYGPNIVRRIFRALGASPPEASEELAHPSLRAPGADLMRIVNRYDLPAEEQSRAAALVLELDALIGERAEPLRASPEAARRVRELSARGWAVIEAMFEESEELPA